MAPDEEVLSMRGTLLEARRRGSRGALGGTFPECMNNIAKNPCYGSKSRGLVEVVAAFSWEINDYAGCYFARTTVADWPMRAHVKIMVRLR